MENNLVPQHIIQLANKKGFPANNYLCNEGDKLFYDISGSLLQTWLREEKKLNLWIEHGSFRNGKVTHDVTTDRGCLRGSYSTYNEALMKGIEILLNELN